MQIKFTNSSPELNYNMAILRKMELSSKTKRNKYVSLQAVIAAQEIIMELKHQPELFNSQMSVMTILKIFSDGQAVKSNEHATCHF